MASYDLTGTGVQTLSAAVTHLFVDVTSFPATFKTGRAAPTNYFDVGLLRLSYHGAVRSVIPVDAAHMIVDLPTHTDALGYALFGSTLIHVTEDFT